MLEDCDLEDTVKQAVTSRFLNAGQSCIAAKRFIVVESIAKDFLNRFHAAVDSLQPGNPMNSSTTLGPMARNDLRDELHQQVIESIKQGAIALTGCAPVEGKGAFYQASILDRVVPGIRAYDEELLDLWPRSFEPEMKTMLWILPTAAGSDWAAASGLQIQNAANNWHAAFNQAAALSMRW